jgi:hypothetical protein
MPIRLICVKLYFELGGTFLHLRKHAFALHVQFTKKYNALFFSLISKEYLISITARYVCTYCDSSKKAEWI